MNYSDELLEKARKLVETSGWSYSNTASFLRAGSPTALREAVQERYPWLKKYERKKSKDDESYD